MSAVLLLVGVAVVLVVAGLTVRYFFRKFVLGIKEAARDEKITAWFEKHPETGELNQLRVLAPTTFEEASAYNLLKRGVVRSGRVDFGCRNPVLGFAEEMTVKVKIAYQHEPECTPQSCRCRNIAFMALECVHLEAEEAH